MSHRKPKVVKAAMVEPLEQRWLLSASLVKDIHAGTVDGNPRPIAVFQDELYFTQSDWNLYRTDGTPGEYQQLTSIRPASGSGSPAVVNWAVPGPNDLFFSIKDRDHGVELWATDGTPQGTRLVKDVNPGTVSSGPQLAVPFGGGVVFGAYGVEAGLWFSDGTEAGTYRLSDQLPLGNHFSTSLTAFNGALYFIRDGEPGYQLWKTDGTAAGTEMVIDLYPGGHVDLYTVEMAVVGNTLYFEGVDAAHGSELWVTDGTAEGTRRVTDLATGAEQTRPRGFVQFGEKLVFSARSNEGHGLYITDGIFLERLYQGGFSQPSAVAGGKLVFRGDSPEAGSEPWVSDGTAAGTSLLVDVNPGPESSYPSSHIAYGGKVYFVANAGPGRGVEVWSSDGTAAGTTRLKDINPQGGMLEAEHSGAPTRWSPQVFDGRLYFNAIDGFHGEELWSTDGTEAGTQFVLDLIDIGNSGSPEHFLSDGAGGAYFTALATDGTRDVWYSDGTEAGTRLVADLTWSHRSSVPEQLTLMGGDLYFVAGGSIHRASKTGTGAEAVARGDNLTAAGNTLFYTAFPYNDGVQWLAASDGTPEGSILLMPAQIPFGTSPVAIGSTLYFIGYVDNQLGLWKSDGTPDGTQVVQELPGTGAEELVVAGDRLFFTANGESDPSLIGMELWISDGTPAGTGRVADLQAGPVGGSPRELTAVSDRVFFVGSDVEHGRELWVSDGTDEGTHLVRDIHPPTAWPPASLRWLMAAGDYVFFVTADTQGVPQMWRSDGTEAGTIAVTQFSGDGLGHPLPLLGYNGVLYFNADEGDEGRRLWASDGTPGNTRRIAEPIPAYQTTTAPPPMFAAGVGDRILFSGSLREVGRELFSVPVPDFVSPEVQSRAFEFEQEQAVRIAFSEDVLASLAPEDLRVVHRESGETILPTVAYDPTGHTATFSFGGTLSDGNYRATLPAGSVEDPAGNPLAKDVTIDFFVLPGDTNRDRKVDFTDFLILRGNFGRTDDPLFSEADFNYDDKVNFADFLILRSKFGASVPAAGSGSLFADADVDDGEGEDGPTGRTAAGVAGVMR